MSEAATMDVSSVQENNQTGGSSSPKHPTSDLKHVFGSKCVCTEPVEQKHETTENVQKRSAEARTAESDILGVEQLRLPEDSTEQSFLEPLRPPPEDVPINSSLEQMGLLAESVTRKSSSPDQTTSELNHEFGLDSVNREQLEQEQVIPTDNVKKGPAGFGTTESDFIGLEPAGSSSEDVTRNFSWEQMRPPPEDLTLKSSLELLGLPPEDVAMNSNLELLEPPPDGVSKNPGLEQVRPSQEDATKNPSQSECGDIGTSVQLRKGKCLLRSSVGSTRVLRSKSQEKTKAPEVRNNVAEDGADREKKRQKKKKQMKRIPVNEFSRIRTHLRYLLHRMTYEQNLIDAYSGEGWKGQSLEKIKPEKELQRAKSEIFRCKLKTRDLFQRLDLLCAEGKLPDSLFDSEGQIDSEDIFCAKCGSKDLAADNDIILCDGACERGFHQFCLEPPLLKEDIPPGDEGWLCPGCDCKVDCIESLNDSQGTNISVIDSWEKVFPEVAVAAGNKLDDSLPSDDSDDDDYNPDAPGMEDKVQGGDESGSDESDFSSASDDSGASPNKEHYLGLSSDDSEDDDYDPNALDRDEQVKQESSSSDFTSDSEDFSAAYDDNRLSGEDQGHMLSSSDHKHPFTSSDGERSKLGGVKRRSLSDELSYLLKSDVAPLSGKRHVERLDYKQLHDETYGIVSSDSSDEDYVETAAPKRRKNNTGKVASLSPNGMTPIIKNGTDAEDMKYSQKESEHTPKRGTSKKLDVEGTNNSPAKSHKSYSEPDSSDKSTTKSAYRRLGEAVTQRLFESFKENQYPERAVKENLAKELGLTVQQVSKWFENARWSFRHSSHMESSIADGAPKKGTPLHQINKKLSEPKPKMVLKDAACNGVENKELPKASPDAMEYCSGGMRAGNMVTEEGNEEKSRTPKSRKREGKLDHRASDHISSAEEIPKQNVQVNAPKAQQVRKSGRIQARSRNSVA